MLWLQSSPPAQITILGNQGSGKSALLQRFCDDDYTDDTESTILTDLRIRNIKLGDTETTEEMRIWDISGDSRFSTMANKYLISANSFIYVIDLNKIVSLFLNGRGTNEGLEFMAKYLDNALYRFSDCQSEPENPRSVVIAFTKSDEDPILTVEQQSDLQQRLRNYLDDKYPAVVVCEILFTSAKENTGLSEVFQAAAKYANTHSQFPQERRRRASTLTLTDKPLTSRPPKSCC